MVNHTRGGFVVGHLVAGEYGGLGLEAELEGEDKATVRVVIHNAARRIAAQAFGAMRITPDEFEIVGEMQVGNHLMRLHA
jgi:hypothetical protein